MKVKKTRQVRLDELLKYVIDNNAYGFYETACGRNSIYIREDTITFNNYIIWANDLFTITEEVEITEDMRLNLVVVDDENQVTDETETKISSLKKEAEAFNYELKFIYLQNEDGSIGELIWSKECGLID